MTLDKMQQKKAEALRENLKKRKQVLKARENQTPATDTETSSEAAQKAVANTEILPPTDKP